MNDKLKLAKNITKFVVGRSIGFVVVGALKNAVPTENKSQDLYVHVGAFVLAGMASDAALDWTDQKFTEVVSAAQKLMSQLKEQTPTE